MATYTELYNLTSDTTLRNRITVACIVAAETIMSEDAGTANHANRLKWAASVFANPSNEATRMQMAVLGSNKSLTVAQFAAATDAAIQTSVSNHIDLFATG
jgi:hypothetical protein